MRLHARAVVFCAAAIALAALILLAPALLRGEGLIGVGMLWRVPPWNAVLTPRPGSGMLVDQLLYFPPWRQFLREELLSGHFPLWNPYILGGVPFAACIQAAPFYPTNLLLFWLPVVPFSLVAAFLKLFFAGFFTALHLRRLGVSREGSALAGIVFALSGFMIAWLGHPHTNTACLLPALFWALGCLREQSAPRPAAVLGLVIGMALLGGHPPTMLHVFGAAAAYAVFLAGSAKPSMRRRFLLFAGLALLVGAGLSAPAILPYLEYYPLSSTGAASNYLARWGTRLSPWLGLHLLMPLASGSPARGAEVLAGAFALGPENNFIERAGWTGLLPLLLAGLAGWRRRREPEVLFHGGLAVVGLAAALGVFPLPYIWKFLPGYSSVNPTRLLLVWGFGVAALSGLGFDACAALPREIKRRLAVGFVAVVVLAASLYARTIFRVSGDLTPAEISFSLTEILLFMGEACVATWLIWDRDRLRRYGLFFAAAALLRFGLGVNPSAPAEIFYPETPAIAAMKAAVGTGRVFGLGWALEPNLGMPFHLRDPRGRDFSTPARYERLVTGRAIDFAFFTGVPDLPVNSSLLAVSVLAATAKNVAAVPKGWKKIYEGDLFVFKSPAPVSRALFVPEARAASSAEVLTAAQTPGFDPARTVWLDDGAVLAPARRTRGRARIVSDGADEVGVEVDSDGPGWLLLLDNWFPGWEATVDGKASVVRRADYSFRAVEVPGGRSLVSFRYRPASFRLGCLLAALAFLALAAGFSRRYNSMT